MRIVSKLWALRVKFGSVIILHVMADGHGF